MARSTTKKSAENSGASSSNQGSARKQSSSRQAPRAQAAPAVRATKVAAQAAQDLVALTGKEAEGITGLERTDDGWTVQVEVVEVRRIPDTTDVLALYEVTTDAQGGLQGYRRIKRYARGVPGDD